MAFAGFSSPEQLKRIVLVHGVEEQAAALKSEFEHKGTGNLIARLGRRDRAIAGREHHRLSREATDGQENVDGWGCPDAGGTGC